MDPYFPSEICHEIHFKTLLLVKLKKKWWMMLQHSLTSQFLSTHLSNWNILHWFYNWQYLFLREQSSSYPTYDGSRHHHAFHTIPHFCFCLICEYQDYIFFISYVYLVSGQPLIHVCMIPRSIDKEISFLSSCNIKKHDHFQKDQKNYLPLLNNCFSCSWVFLLSFWFLIFFTALHFPFLKKKKKNTF